jgi:hypothetical protein
MRTRRLVDKTIGEMEHLETVRSAEQLGFDLATALQFSIKDLRAFRKGILPAASGQVLFSKIAKPLLRSAALTLVPLFGVAFLISSSHHSSISDGLLMVFASVGHIKELADTEGWFRTVLYFLGGLTLLGLGAYQATRIPMDLAGDILVKRVRSLEGRVTSREEEINVGKKRDDVVNYYFEMKHCKFEVSRRAYLAIDSGGAYRVYYLPRSRTLVAIEPSLLAKEAEEKEQKLKERPVVQGTI